MEINFAGYTFRFWLLTTANRYEPEDLSISQAADGLVARAGMFSFGDGAGTTPGLLEVTFHSTAEGISWTARASHAEAIKGIRVCLSPLPVGAVTVPVDAEFTLKDGDPGRVFGYPGAYYPLRHVSSTGVEPGSGPLPTWAVQLAIFHGSGQNVILSAREYPPRVKKLWVYRKGEHQEVYLYSEQDACRRGQEYTAPTWWLCSAADWRPAVEAYSRWMGQAFQMQAFAERPGVQPWLKDIRLMVILHGGAHDGKIGYDYRAMAGCLAELAQRFPAKQTLVKLAGFEGRIDRSWPDVEPAPVLGGAEAFDALISGAHRLGYHLIPHLNVWGASYENPKTQALLAHQIIDPEGRPSTWSYDHDQDEMAEEIFAYISPDTPEWRAVIKEQVRCLTERGMDAIYLDQTGTFINDLRHDHYRGLKTMYAELGDAFKQTQFAGEAPVSEVTASLVSLVCGIPILKTEQLAEIYRMLFGSYTRNYGYNLPPEPYRGVWGPLPMVEWWSKERYLRYVERSGWVGGIPSLSLTDRRIDLDGELVKVVLEQAKQYKI
jgi:hypothetical protein